VETDVIIEGDWLAVLKDTPAGSVQCVVTSPPYWGLRDYKVGGQLGLEKTPAEYVAKLVEGFRELWRVLRDDGTVWLNLGDSYASGKGTCRNPGGGPKSYIQEKERFPLDRGNVSTLRQWGLKPKDLVGIPWMVAFALRDDGWWLRSDIIWAKPNPMPESVTDRPTRAHEYVFLLTKKARYYYDQEAIKEGNVTAPHAAGYTSGDEYATGPMDRGGASQREGDQSRIWGVSGGRNKRSVWTIPTQAYAAAHFATFPEKLVEPCILAGTSAQGCCPECGAPWKRVVEKSKRFESGSGRSGNAIAGKHGEKCQGGGDTGDIRKGPCLDTQTTGWEPTCKCGYDDTRPCLVLDPFMGSGTVAVVAKRLGRDFVGIELSPDYVTLAEKRLREACPLLLKGLT